ncbi:MAG: hypothetical protein AVDCRST_MAG93-4052 [uncultured Chloroflexia bacterium]|uniref:Cytoskeleton protein RodZ-like C-terminal domain-containing protein n=1 Tax=uncultured Chloroflexia bacterium TaxID=1672391 RepID=A0A6J4K1B4_9CHLR|nr:MAG: hypothetical protein AVDCRST_MAG93-4052 [uncultured Chloroflexia bacterium]
MTRFLDKLNTPQAVAVVLMFFLVVNGFLFYRYQQLEVNNATSTIIDAESVVVEAEAIASVDQEPDIAEEPDPTEEQEPATEEEITVPTESAPSPKGEVEVVRLVVGVSGAPSWLRVQEDRQIVLSRVSEPGFSREFVADQAISLQVGNAGAVQVEVNGRNLGPLGADGEVATRTYTTQKGREAS